MLLMFWGLKIMSIIRRFEWGAARGTKGSLLWCERGGYGVCADGYIDIDGVACACTGNVALALCQAVDVGCATA